MLRILLLRGPKEEVECSVQIEVIQTRIKQSGIFFEFFTSGIACMERFVNKICEATNWSVKIIPELKELDVNSKIMVSKIDYLHSPHSKFAGEESLTQQRLRVELWLETMINQFYGMEKDIIICADALTLEHIHCVLSCTPPFASLKTFVAHEIFNFHVWSGEVFQNLDYIWCLRAVNINAKNLDESIIPLKKLFLVE